MPEGEDRAWECYLWDGEWQVAKHVKGVGVMGADWTVQGTAQLTREQFCDRREKIFEHQVHQDLNWTEVNNKTFKKTYFLLYLQKNQ